MYLYINPYRCIVTPLMDVNAVFCVCEETEAVTSKHFNLCSTEEGNIKFHHVTNIDYVHFLMGILMGTPTSLPWEYHLNITIHNLSAKWILHYWHSLQLCINSHTQNETQYLSCQKCAKESGAALSHEIYSVGEHRQVLLCTTECGKQRSHPLRLCMCLWIAISRSLIGRPALYRTRVFFHIWPRALSHS